MALQQAVIELEVGARRAMLGQELQHALDPALIGAERPAANLQGLGGRLRALQGLGEFRGRQPETPDALVLQGLQRRAGGGLGRPRAIARLEHTAGHRLFSLHEGAKGVEEADASLCPQRLVRAREGAVVGMQVVIGDREDGVRFGARGRGGRAVQLVWRQQGVQAWQQLGRLGLQRDRERAQRSIDPLGSADRTVDFGRNQKRSPPSLEGGD